VLDFKTIGVGSVARSTLLLCPEQCFGFFYWEIILGIAYSPSCFVRTFLHASVFCESLQFTERKSFPSCGGVAQSAGVVSSDGGVAQSAGVVSSDGVSVF